MSAPAAASKAPRDFLRAVATGLASGAVLGVLEAVERTASLRGFISGAGSRTGFALLVLGWILLAGVLAGVLAGAALGIAGALRRALGDRALAARVISGAALGTLATGWGVLALTLTGRFDAWIARAPLLLFSGGALGAIALPVIGAVRDRTRGRITPRRRALITGTMATGVLGVYLVDAYFAPQSSYGVHVLFDTMLGALAWILVWAIAPSRRVATLLALLLIALLPWMDYAMRRRPALEMLLRTRTALAGRVADLVHVLLDFDRDGSSTRTLAGGKDIRPFDPTVPPPLAILAFPDPADAWARDLADTIWLPAPEDRAHAAGKPNLILLTLDACRSDVMPGNRPLAPWLQSMMLSTPALDSLAARAARWDAAYTPSAGTEDTFNSLFTGRDLPGILAGVPDDRYLPRRMVRAGYAARAFANDAHFPAAPWGWPRIKRTPLAGARDLARELVEFLGSRPSGEPGFAWYHVMDMHAEVLLPWSPEAYGLAAHMRRYSDGLSRVDATVGVLFDELRRTGLDRNTVVVISADHGEEFGGHGHFHHNLSVYEPAIRVPLWVIGPGVAPGRRRRVTSLQDLYPTFLEAAGIAPDSTAGTSLWPELRDSSLTREPRAIYSFLPQRGFSRRYAISPHAERGQAALIEPASGHKLILRFADECEEVYDVSRDPLERENLADAPPAWVDTMKRALFKRVRGMPADEHELAAWR